MPKRDFDTVLRDQHPLMLSPSATVCEACAAMHTRHVGSVLVVDPEQRLLGIFCGRDAVNLLARRMDPCDLTLEQAMTRAPECLGPEGTAIQALRLMQDGGFRHVPIVDRGRAIGVVSRRDFCSRDFARLEDETRLWERL